MKKIVHAIRSVSAKAIAACEKETVPFYYYVLSFIAVLTFRTFLEIFADPDHGGILLIRYFHYYSFWSSLVISLLLVFHAATKLAFTKIARVLLAFTALILVAPLLDLSLTLGKGMDIAYMKPGMYDNLLVRFFTFFGPYPGQGITLGMKIEIALILCFCFVYFFEKTQQVIKSLFFTFISYSVIFLYLATPFWLKALLEAIGVTYRYSDRLIVNCYAPILLVTLLAVARISKKQMLEVIIKDIRILRLIHYELMFLLGLVVSAHFSAGSRFSITAVTVFHPLFIIISIACAWIYSVMTNNMQDLEIDKVSNAGRPLVTNAIDPALYAKIAWYVLAGALLFAALVNFKTFFLILFFIGNYFAYSMPPFRIKRIPFISKLVIALNSLALIFVGALLVGGSIFVLPWQIVLLVLLGFSLAVNFIDLKDYEGDKKEGIRTLPVIVGLPKAKKMIGIFFFGAYCGTWFLLQSVPLMLIFFVLGIVQVILINKEDYSERPVFLVYLFSILLFLYCYLP